MKKRILIFALAVGAIALTLALSSRHDDLRRSDAAPSARVVLNPPPAVSPTPEPEQTEPQSEPRSDTQSEPNSTPDADRGRGTERSARAR